MFEHLTFEYLMERSMAKISEDIDKRESGIVYTALAINNAEMAQAFIWMDQILKLAFAQTSEGQWLEARAYESGVERKPATRALRRATFNISVQPGERFFVDDIYFRVTEDGNIESEAVGEAGNGPLTGTRMLPLNNISGLETALVGEIIRPGEEVESDASLLERYLIERRRKATSGNKAHYKKWAEEVPGVGKARVFPLWNGRGTVKIVIVNSAMQPASPEIVQAVQDYISPIPEMGEGEAQIGATLTVESAEIRPVTISARVKLNGGTIETAKEAFEEELAAIFKKLAFADEGSTLKIITISNVFYRNKWIEDFDDVTINGSPENLELSENEIPELTEVVLLEY